MPPIGLGICFGNEESTSEFTLGTPPRAGISRGSTASDETIWSTEGAYGPPWTASWRNSVDCNTPPTYPLNRMTRRTRPPISFSEYLPAFSSPNLPWNHDPSSPTSPSNLLSPAFQPLAPPPDPNLHARDDGLFTSQSPIATAALSLGVVFGVIAIGLSGTMLLASHRRRARHRKNATLKLATARASFSSRSASATAKHRMTRSVSSEDYLPPIDEEKFPAYLVDRRSEWLRMGLDSPSQAPWAPLKAEPIPIPRPIEKQKPLPVCPGYAHDHTRCLVQQRPDVHQHVPVKPSPLRSAPVWTWGTPGTPTIPSSPLTPALPAAPKASVAPVAPVARVSPVPPVFTAEADRACASPSPSTSIPYLSSPAPRVEHDPKAATASAGPNDFDNSIHNTAHEDPVVYESVSSCECDLESVRSVPFTALRSPSLSSSSVDSIASHSVETVDSSEENCTVECPTLRAPDEVMITQTEEVLPEPPTITSMESPEGCETSRPGSLDIKSSPTISVKSDVENTSLMAVTFATLLSPHIDALLASASSASLFRPTSSINTLQTRPSSTLSATRLPPPSIMISPPSDNSLFSISSCDMLHLDAWPGDIHDDDESKLISDISDSDLPQSGSWASVDEIESWGGESVAICATLNAAARAIEDVQAEFEAQKAVKAYQPKAVGTTEPSRYGGQVSGRPSSIPVRSPRLVGSISP